MADTPIMQVLQDPLFLQEAVKRISAHFNFEGGQTDDRNRKAASVLLDMSYSISKFGRLTDNQQNYARDLIERHFLSLLTKKAQEHKAVEDEQKASVKQYVENPQWGVF